MPSRSPRTTAEARTRRAPPHRFLRGLRDARGSCDARRRARSRARPSRRAAPAARRGRGRRVQASSSAERSRSVRAASRSGPRRATSRGKSSSRSSDPTEKETMKKLDRLRHRGRSGTDRPRASALVLRHAPPGRRLPRARRGHRRRRRAGLRSVVGTPSAPRDGRPARAAPGADEERRPEAGRDE